MMKEYPVAVYGIVVGYDDLKEELRRRTKEAQGLNAESELADEDIDEMYACEIDRLMLIDETLSGEYFKVNEDGRISDEHAEMPLINNDDVYGILLLGRGPSLCQAAYKDYNDIIESLKKDFGGILPKNFDYEGRFCFYFGTVFC